MLNNIQKLSRELTATAMSAEIETRMRSEKARSSLQHVDWDTSAGSTRKSSAATQTRR